MRSVSAAFSAAITGSYRLATLAEVLDSDGTATEVPITEGTVTLDKQAAVRARCDVTLADDGTLDLVPTGPSSLLAPYGNELRLSRGITFPDGTTELVTLGVFRIQDVDVDDTGAELTIRIAGLDRAQRISDGRFEQPFQIASGTNFGTAIEQVLETAWPDVLTDFTAVTDTVPNVFAQEGDDPWTLAQKMATDLGMSLYFDGDGVARLAQDSSQPVFTVAEGSGGVLVRASRRMTRQSVYNRVIATGEGVEGGAPSRGVATDDDPTSPTFYDGDFGRVPRFYSSPFITNTAQAESAALKILRDQLGASQSVVFDSFVLPHLEPGDAVRVTRERAGIDEDHVLDQITIPLAATGVMGCQTRAQTVTT